MHKTHLGAELDLSIIIPTFRREREVVEAIRSCTKISGINFEILVVDDSPEGSASDHVAQFDDPRVRYLRREQPSGGLPAVVRNEAVQRSRGQFLYFLDDDDRIEPETIVKMVRASASYSGCVAIGAVLPEGPQDSQVVQGEIAHYRHARALMRSMKNRYQLVSRLLFHSSIIVCSACLISRSAFEKLGGFRTDLPLYEDVEFYIRAIRKFGFVYVDEVLLHRRTGVSSLINNESDDVRTLQSYRLINEGYKSAFHPLEFYALKLYSYRWKTPRAIS